MSSVVSVFFCITVSSFKNAVEMGFLCKQGVLCFAGSLFLVSDAKSAKKMHNGRMGCGMFCNELIEVELADNTISHFPRFC